MSASAPEALSSGNGPRVLVVDDHADCRNTLADLCSALGCLVGQAKDGMQALRVGRGLRPHLVLLDIAMPTMNGFEAAAAMRADPAFRETVVAAVTGWATSRDMTLASAAGIDAFFVKPMNMQSLEGLIALAHGRALAETATRMASAAAHLRALKIP